MDFLHESLQLPTEGEVLPVSPTAWTFDDPHAHGSLPLPQEPQTPDPHHGFFAFAGSPKGRHHSTSSLGHIRVNLPSRTVEPSGETPVPEQTPGHLPTKHMGSVPMLITPTSNTTEVDAPENPEKDSSGSMDYNHKASRGWEISPSPHDGYRVLGIAGSHSASLAVPSTDSEAVGYIPPPAAEHYRCLSFSLDLGDLHSPREPASFWSPRVFRKAGRRPPQTFYSQSRPTTNRDKHSVWAHLTLTSPTSRDKHGDRVSFTEVNKSWELSSPSNGEHTRKKPRSNTTSMTQWRSQPHGPDRQNTETQDIPTAQAPKRPRRRRRRRSAYARKRRNRSSSSIHRHGLRGSNGRFVSRRNVETTNPEEATDAAPKTPFQQQQQH